MGRSVRKDTHSLTHPFGGLAMKKQNGSTKNSIKGKMRLEVHRHLLHTLGAEYATQSTTADGNRNGQYVVSALCEGNGIACD